MEGPPVGVDGIASEAIPSWKCSSFSNMTLRGKNEMLVWSFNRQILLKTSSSSITNHLHVYFHVFGFENNGTQNKSAFLRSLVTIPMLDVFSR